MNERTRLERLALAAHDRGDDWGTFWPSVAGDVVAAESDWYERGRFVHRLVGLVASGDLDGQRPVDAGYGRPLDFELEAAR